MKNNGGDDGERGSVVGNNRPNNVTGAFLKRKNV